MRVYKFGGASVKDAAGVKNLAAIVRHAADMELVIVVSAMGKITNKLETLVSAYRNGQDTAPILSEVKVYHTGLVADLGMTKGPGAVAVEVVFDRLQATLAESPSDQYDFDYDQIVSYGEVISTTIIAAYLRQEGIEAHWSDARKLIRTDATYREGRIDWAKTESLVQAKWEEVKSDDSKPRILVIQGFIGHTAERSTTTLGREGSDFTAAVMAYVLNGESVTIWKDVPGVLNADPKYFSDAVKLKRISYREAIELAYYGATVIHPKTIKPLQNKNIVLYVRSFSDFKSDGTQIDASTFSDSLIPSYIFKVNQILISFTPRDFSFITEDNLGSLFVLFGALRIKVNLMQNSAINFSVCIDHDEAKVSALLERCKPHFEVLYNAPCELVTIRHYDQETISRLLIGKKVLVEQRSRATARMVMVEA